MELKKKLIKKIILKKRPLKIDEFISLSLFEKNSYYRSRLPIGIKGDFILSAYLTSTMGVSFKLKALR